MKEQCLLACFPWLAKLAVLYNPGLLAQDGGTPTVSWTLPPLFINQENAPQICLQANLMETFS